MRSLARFDEMRISGLLPSFGAFLYVVHAWIDPARPPTWSLAVPIAMLLAGVSITRAPRAARIVATVALGGWLHLTADALRPMPAAALAVWLPSTWLLATLWIVPGLPSPRRLASQNVDPQARLARVRVALRMTAMLAILVALSRSELTTASRWAVVASLVVTLGFILRADPVRLFDVRRTPLLLIVPTLMAIALWEVESASETALVILTLLMLFATGFARDPSHDRRVRVAWWERLLENPARQLVATFLVLILIGTLFLGLPVAATTQAPVAFVDAAFTAVSAVCVTGLIVLDTPVDWSPTGQAIILVLIQLGGLGIMSFATAFLSALGRRLSVRQEGAFAELASQDNRYALYEAVKGVLRITLVAESLGVLLLLWRFWMAGEEWSAALWRAVFTSVSAFCNAGFALQSDSLMGYAQDPWVLHTVGTLIVIGGLSPAVVIALARRRVRSVQTKLVLWTTGILLGLGALLFGASEWNNSLAEFGGWDKIHNAWFQSVTLRTAGFNSIDFEGLRPATITLCMLWMFIGGSPGGTAGGIKTTTFAVLVLAVFATVQGKRSVDVFGRTIPHTTVFRATAIATIGSLSLVGFLLSIQLTQVTGIVAGVFEVVSALGTVGLSMGATATLDTVGKIIIMAAMFAGRVGSLTLLVFLLAQHAQTRWRLPEETVDVG